VVHEPIRKVTITGIDQFTNRMRLQPIQQFHPFVKWGVLLSSTKAGQDNRYPPVEWINDTLAHPLDLDKVEAFLDIAAPYVLHGPDNANNRPASEDNAASGSTPATES
jgi:hypothetical protein